MQTTSHPPRPPPRRRAGRACKGCNARRMRCNIVDTQPCDNCKGGGISCELVPSSRGKYDRRAKFASTPVSKRASSRNVAKDVSVRLPFHDPVHFSGDVNPTIALSETHSSTIPLHGSDISSETSVFLGEPNPLTAIDEQEKYTSTLSKHKFLKLRFALPENLRVTTSGTRSEDARRDFKLEQLTNGGAFSLPSDAVCQALLDGYFGWFHPCFPIIDKRSFREKYLSKSVPSLLLQAVLFVGAMHADTQRLAQHGESRKELRSSLYHRAREIYDADYETDHVTTIQALFLMSFWRTGLLLQKGTWHWLGVAIGLAQSKGVHYAPLTSDATDCSLKNRIWWCLYIRDRQTATSLGLPARIRCEECMIELPSALNFISSSSPSSIDNMFAPESQEHISYFVQSAKLAVLLERIMACEFPHQKSVSRDPIDEKIRLRRDLGEWETKLPLEMSLSRTSSSPWASFLHMAFNNLYIFLYRSDFLALRGDDLVSTQPALEKACQITRLVEDLLSRGEICGHGSPHMINCIFNALCIHTIHLRRSSGTVRKLAECRAQICLLGLCQLQSTWNLTNVVSQLFFSSVGDETKRRLEGVLHIDEASLEPTQPQEVEQNTVSSAVLTSSIDEDRVGNSFAGTASSFVQGSSSCLPETSQADQFWQWPLTDLHLEEDFNFGLESYFGEGMGDSSEGMLGMGLGFESV